MDYQYYKNLFISIAGIYIVYLNFGLVQEKMYAFCNHIIHSYRYQSIDGSRFKYTSCLLLIQCTINLVIASISTPIYLILDIGEYFFGEKRKQFDLQTPKKELIGREVIINNRGV